jgi:hypothetical protein
MGIKTFWEFTVEVEKIIDESWILDEEHWEGFSKILMEIIGSALVKKEVRIDSNVAREKALWTPLDQKSMFFISWSIDERLQLEWALQVFVNDLSEFERDVFEWIVAISLEQDTLDDFINEVDIAKTWFNRAMKAWWMPQTQFSTKIRKLLQWIINDKKPLKVYLDDLISRWIVQPQQITLSPGIQGVLSDIKRLVDQTTWKVN